MIIIHTQHLLTFLRGTVAFAGALAGAALGFGAAFLAAVLALVAPVVPVAA